MVLVFFAAPIFNQTKIAQSDQEELYSPTSNLYNSQNVAVLSPKFRPATKGPTGGADEIMTDDEALVANVSPITDVEAEKVMSASPDDISVYTVREGDTLGEIAEMFDISPNTIRWANNIDVKGTVKPGQELVILPISGIKHKVVKGETFASIAKKYSGDAREISLFNGIEEDEELVAGTEIIIPNGESEAAPATKPTAPKGGSTSTPASGGKGYFVRAWGGIVTQGFHDKYRAKDYGMPLGSKVGASAAGTVIVAREGWNGGYGTFIIIKHPNGAQTLYAHLSKLLVATGQAVTQKETIGLSGSTGRSTGPHLHFEIRGWGDITF